MAMRIGLLCEPVLRTLYEREGHGRIVRSQVFLRDPERPYVTATVDGLEESGRVVELKAISPFMTGHVAALDAGEVPDRWQMQVQQQMHLAGADEADVAVLIGLHLFKVIRVRRHNELIRLILDREAEFWDHIVRDVPPLNRPSRDLRVVQALYPHCRGVVALGLRERALAQDYLDAGRRVKEAEDRRDALKAELLSAMGDCEIGELPEDGSIVRKVITVHEEARAARTRQYVRFTVKGLS